MGWSFVSPGFQPGPFGDLVVLLGFVFQECRELMDGHRRHVCTLRQKQLLDLKLDEDLIDLPVDT
jgi:hypothetical protein